MTAVSVSGDYTRIDTLDTLNAISNIGGGAGAGLEPDFVYQGGGSISRKVGTAQRGFAWDGTVPVTPVTFDFTAARRTVCMYKINITNKDALDPQTTPGLQLQLGSASTAYFNYDLSLLKPGAGISEVYKIKGGWLIFPVDPNIATWRDGTTGTPDNTAVDWVGLAADFSATSRAENVIMDAVDQGYGLNMIGGEGTEVDGIFEDFVNWDEGDVFNRVGFVSTDEDILFVFGKLTFGKDANQNIAAVGFNDKNRTLVFPHHLAGSGFSGLDINISHPSSTVDFATCSFIGTGLDDRKIYFDSELEVTGGATDEIDKVAHGYETGDAIFYSAETGTAITGLTNNTVYYAIKVDDDNFQVATNKTDAFGSTAISITPAGAGAGQNHSFTREIDTRFDLNIINSSGTFTDSGSSFQRMRRGILTTGATLTNTNFVACGELIESGAILSNVTFDEPLEAVGKSMLISNDLDNISNCTFNANSNIHLAGHAIKITEVGSYTFVGNSFNNYGPTVQTFNTTTSVSGTLETITIAGHPYTNGDPVFYNKEGQADTIGLTDGNLYYVESVNANSIALHLSQYSAENSSNPIDLTVGTSGEVHSFYSAYAAIHNASSGDVTIGITGGGDSPSYRNSIGANTIVNNAVTIRVEGLTEGSAASCIANETAGTITTGDVIFNKLADSAGVAELTTFNYEAAFGAGLDVIIRARNQGFPNAAIADDGGAQTDETTSANSTTIDDMTLLPASPAVDDAYYFAHNEEFSQLNLELSQDGVGTWTIVWQYWNGAWTNLSDVVDGTSGFTADGTVSWTLPSDWADTTINGQGPFRYVRARVSAFTSITTQPLGRKCKLGVTRYLPFEQNRTVVSTGLTVVANWIEDTISSF